MALADEVKTRVSTARLRELTNKDTRGPAVAIDDTVLNAAAADAAAEFEIETGLSLDVTDAAHVAVGVHGVLYYLLTYAATKASQLDSARQRWEQGLRKLDLTIGGGRRVTPYTASTLDPSEEVAGRRPDQDLARWDDYVIGPGNLTGDIEG